MMFFVLTPHKGKFSEHYLTSHSTQAFGVVSHVFFELRLLCYLAPLKHYAEAIQLSEELSKVLKQLPCTFSSHRRRSRLRRLWSKFKGALLTILLFEELAIRARGLRIHVLMLHYVCLCCEEPFGVDFVEIGSSVN